MSRFRDVLAWSTALPGSALMVGCLFLPQFRDCHGHVETPLESGLAALMIPIALFGLMPLLWRLAPSLRRVLPQLVLAVAVLALTWLVLTIPLAVFLLWTYARGSRGQELVAMCSALCVLLFIFLFPLFGVFCTWLPGAELTWTAAWLEAFGLLAWAGAAQPDEAVPDHEVSVVPTRDLGEGVPRSGGDVVSCGPCVAPPPLSS